MCRDEGEPIEIEVLKAKVAYLEGGVGRLTEQRNEKDRLFAKLIVEKRQLVQDKIEILMGVHKAIWKGDDLMEQEDLMELQGWIDHEICQEHNKGNVIIKQHNNGFIHEIKIVKGRGI